MPNLPRLFLLCVLLLSFLPGCRSTRTSHDPAYVDAVEVKLKCRELADQILATMPNDALQGFVAMPTSFVDQNNTSRSSPLARQMPEEISRWLVNAGYRYQELRKGSYIRFDRGTGELILTREVRKLTSTRGTGQASLEGT